MAGAVGRGGLARLLQLIAMTAFAALLATGIAASMPSSAWAEEAFDADAVPQVLGGAEVAGDVELFAAQAEVDMVDALAAPIERNYDFAFQVLDLVNEERAAAGVDPLTMDPQLLNAAMNVRAVECSVLFSHERPDGQTCFTAAPGLMYGENIAFGQLDPEDVMDSWMNSTGHRQNILDPDYKSIGIGCVYAGDFGPYWVQCFGINEVASPAKNPGDSAVIQRISVPRSWLTASNFVFEYNYYSVEPGESDEAVVAFRNQGSGQAYCILDPSIFQWASEKPSVATVSAAGVITGKAPGTTNVVAKLGKLVSVSAPVQVEGEMGTWKKSGGKWWFQLEDGSYPYSQWARIDGDWYHFDRSGYMQTGWLKLGKSWYYLKSSGPMAEGWQKVGGAWYYLNPGSGAMATGWKQVGGTWYYLKGSGAMATGWQKVGGSWYYLKGSGAMAVGWQKIGGTWYYLKDSGAMATGWRQIDGHWYFLSGSGAMAKNKWVGDYYVTGSGAMATNTWIGKYHVNAAGKWDQTR